MPPGDITANSMPTDAQGITGQRGFPASLLRSGDSVLCLGGATSQGRTALVPLLDLRLKDVLVADHSAEKLAAVRERFPGEWEYVVDNYLDACRHLLSEDETFDVVVCESSAGTEDHLWELVFPFAVALARRLLIVRASGDYLQTIGAHAQAEDIASLVHRGFGMRMPPADVALRSRAHGGTYWVTFEIDPGRRSEALAALKRMDEAPGRGSASLNRTVSYGTEHCVVLADLLDSNSCPQADSCRETVDAFRRTIAAKESQSIFRVFTPSRFAAFPPGRIDSFDLAAAVLDLARFQSRDELLEATRVITSKKGRVPREVNKAERLGYYVKRFDQRLFVPDLYSIHTSADIRGGKPMRAAYQASIEEMGGFPSQLLEPTPRPCPLHFSEHWGVFRPNPGHKQGQIVTDEELVGYVHLSWMGNHGRYSRIMGHTDHLQAGVMYLLHVAIVEDVLQHKDLGLRYLCYGGWHSRRRTGTLREWKRRALFEPKFLVYEDVGEWTGPRGMTYVGDALEGR